MRRSWMAAALALAVGSTAAAAPATAATTDAPGRPGAKSLWTPADKDGFGTSAGRASKVWFTIGDGRLTEVYYPDLGTPSIRSLELVVTDGRTFAERETQATDQTVELADPRALSWRQVDTARSGAYRITKTYVTDPARNTVMVDVDFESLSGAPYQVYVLLDPALANDGMDDSASASGGALMASDRHLASALVTQSGFWQTGAGYVGRSDPWRELRTRFSLNQASQRATRGNVAQAGRTRLTGLGAHRHLTLALGFGRTRAAALTTARRSLHAGFAPVATAYAQGWDAYLAARNAPPAAAAPHLTLYDVSLMTLAATEDKTHRGAFVASPTMPWAFGQGLESPSGAYHLVWPRDLLQVATALIAAGDRPAAERALDFMLLHQQRRDGSFTQNTTVDGTPHWMNVQMDEVAAPLLLAWQLDRADRATWRRLKWSADYLVRHGPRSQQERWENQDGYSPATIASEIAALVCAGDIARRNGDERSAARYQRTADAWQAGVERWTATTTGPYSPRPYYLRLTKHRDPDAATTYPLGDGGPEAIDQRAVVDPSFLELVRLGVKPADDPAIVNSLEVVDSRLAVDTPAGRFWHRYDQDGYGEQRDGGPWLIAPPGSGLTVGRAWPIFAGERGEYELLRGSKANARLAAIASSAGPGLMLPEQVWDQNPPSGMPGFASGSGTTSATPLAWSHAQFVRLAWSIDAGHPVEQPSIVACRYAGRCG